MQEILILYPRFISPFSRGVLQLIVNVNFNSLYLDWQYTLV